MSRTVFGLVAIGAAVIAAALGVAWQGKLREQAALDRPAGRSTEPTASASAATAPPASPAPAAAPRAAEAGSVAAAPPPTFDVARIGPDGRAVIAGRATAGARIVLLDGGKEIAKTDADARGEWVVIVQDPPLPVGQHELRVVQHIDGRAPLTSEQSVVAVVPERPAGPNDAKKPEETLVMIAPGKGSPTLVQAPSPAGVPRSADLALSTLDYDDHGHMTISGQAQPGTSVRAYINDKIVAEGTAGQDGKWRLKPAEPIAHGKHTLRLDRIANDGKPVARLEMPFDRVVVEPASKSDARRLYIVRGDNLWNIAHAHYGAGFHYTVIFGANKDQIRDPHLIYPGQVVTIPNVN